MSVIDHLYITKTIKRHHPSLMLGFKFVDVRIEYGSIPKFFRFYDFEFHAIVSIHLILKKIYSRHTMHL